MKLPNITTSERTLATLTLSLIVACLLSAVRGGFDTIPFIVFIGGAFLLALGWQIFSREKNIASIEASLRLRLANFVRYTLVFVVLIILLVWSGPIITSGGFAGWLIALLVWLASPTIVCPLAPRYPILFGILAAGCTAFSLAVQNSRLHSLSREIQWSEVFSEPRTLFVVWGIAAVMSLLVSIPVNARRRVVS